MTEYFVAVPAHKNIPIDAGSGIVMTDNSTERVAIDFESNRAGVPELNVYADRVFHALGRAQTSYPTTAHLVTSRDNFVVIGRIDELNGVVIVDDNKSAALKSWIGNYDATDLTSTSTRHATERSSAAAGTTDGRTLRGERTRQAMRARILDESRRVLRSGTMYDLTVRSIAKHINVSRVTIYHHFPTPLDICRALSDETIAKIFSNLPEVPAAERSYLEKFVSLALEVFLSDSLLVRNLVLATEMGKSDGRSSWWEIDLETLLEHVVEQLAPEMRPVSSDPALSARVMVTYFRGALYGWAAGFIDDETFAIEVRRAPTLGVAAI